MNNLFFIFKTSTGEDNEDEEGEQVVEGGPQDGEEGNVEKKPEDEEKKNGPGENVVKQEIQVKIEVKKESEEKKELTQEELVAEERRRLAESYRKHKIGSHPPEEYWVPVRNFQQKIKYKLN